MQLKKLQIKIILLVVLVFQGVTTCHGIERAGQMGQSWSFPVFLDPIKSYDEVTYHFDTAYFLYEQWAAELSLDAQVGGRQLFYLEFGPNFYPVPDAKVLPYLSGRFLYTMVPHGDLGWLANIGFEIPLGRSYQIENLKLRVNTGGGQFFFDSGSNLFLELVRLGFVWNF